MLKFLHFPDMRIIFVIQKISRMKTSYRITYQTAGKNYRDGIDIGAQSEESALEYFEAMVLDPETMSDIQVRENFPMVMTDQGEGKILVQQKCHYNDFSSGTFERTETWFTTPEGASQEAARRIEEWGSNLICIGILMNISAQSKGGAR